MAESIVIKELLDNPFSVRPLRGESKTVNKGQPTPPLPSLTFRRLMSTIDYIPHR